MFLRKLALINFRNYPEAELFLDPFANAFTGGNGEGKTNLLDAVHYLSMCKSYFNPIDGQNIRFAEDFFMIQGSFELEQKEEQIYCGIKRNQKKVFKRNQKEYERLADHIGLIPVVMVSPTDTSLITEGSEERRKFLDSIISQYDKFYLDDLINYARVLAQRNAYLKQAAQSRHFDADSLAAWDDPLIRLAEKIHAVRQKFIGELIPIFKRYYEFISGGKEEIDVRYESQLNDADFKQVLEQAQGKDRALQYTSVGIHKDDLAFLIHKAPVKRFASQGQQKSFLIALKLAQFDFISAVKGIKPILLLDDIFDKLDDQRVARLMELVSKDNFGQLLISDTHPERIQKIFDDIGRSIRCFHVKAGSIVGEKMEL
ncbi:MAG: DNA replication/repair protein RecF [Bacteroidetes bacterium]|nr:DNA replication/repair protein RecF [Bacteroidota bacterium]MBL0257004.1 DNA replication/repair protein RecF [Bacteroidota bacterium]